MKKALSVILAVIMIWCVSVPALAADFGKTYYIDSENGSDSNSGLSEYRAWKSLDALSDKSFGAGDKILLKAGSVFNGSSIIGLLR